MGKSGTQIQTDFYNFLKNSELDKATSGELYHKGLRPRDSKKEDIVVAFVAGVPSDIDTGTISICIYIPNILFNGRWVQDISRTLEIENLADRWMKSLTAARSNYKVELRETISTYEEVEINQHFVSIRIKFNLKD